jgi:hypothetical protein
MSTLTVRSAAGLPLVGHHARVTLLYANDFTETATQGRSLGPRGEGLHAADADCMVPFQYRVVVDTGRDGRRAARFPTKREQPGGGNYYSWFAAYVACRRGLATGDRLYTWTVHLPRTLRLDSRCGYYENRHVFSIGVEDRESHIGVRFENERSLVWTRGVNAHEEVLGSIELRRALRPGEPVQFSSAVRWDTGAVAVAIDGDDGVLAVGTAPITSLTHASVAVLSSSGNTASSNEDPSEFCRLSQVRVYAVDTAGEGRSEARSSESLEDGSLVLPASRDR